MGLGDKLGGNPLILALDSWAFLSRMILRMGRQ